MSVVPPSKQGSSAAGGSQVVRPRGEARRQAADKGSSQSAKGFLVPPDINGPRVRVGVLWFFVAMAAATAGRYSAAALWSAVSAMAAYQIVAAWQRSSSGAKSVKNVPRAAAQGMPGRLIAVAGCVAVIMASSYSVGAAGLALFAVPLIGILLHIAAGGTVADSGATTIGMVLPVFAGASAVLAVRADLWSGLFLVLAVSIYDAGSYLLGAEAGAKWEGPVAGVIGVLSVAFTMAAFQPAPFNRVSAAVAGVVIAVTCPIGQWLASAFLPHPADRVPALRRIDAYLVAAPSFVICAALAAL